MSHLVEPSETLARLEKSVQARGRFPDNLTWGELACYYLYDIALSLRVLADRDID